MKIHPADQNRRRLLVVATTLGVAPWLLSACAQTAGASRATADKPVSTGRRRLGPFEVYPIGLGVQWHPGRSSQAVADLYSSSTSRQGGIALIRRALDVGVTLFDTAEAYGPFISEELLGEALQGSLRDRAVVCTKFGFDIDPATGQRRGSVNSRPDHIRQVVEAQLRRLRTDRIDLLYQHRVDLVKTWAARKNVTPAQLSLAWLTAQRPWIVPIPGTTNVAHLEENVAAASISFSAAELKELNAAVTAIPIRGARLSPAVLSATGVEAAPKR